MLRTRLITMLGTVLAAALLAGPLTSCAVDREPLPEGAELLAESAAAMRTVTSVSFDAQIDGDLPVPIRSAQGQLSREGSAQGTVVLDLGAQSYEAIFVILGDKLYLRGPTGGFQELSRSSAFLTYDPTLILDPDTGVAAVLADARDAQTEAREQVDGVDSYRVRVRFSGDSLERFVPGYAPDVMSRMWIAADGYRIVRAEFPIANGTVHFRFFDYNVPLEVTPPI